MKNAGSETAGCAGFKEERALRTGKKLCSLILAAAMMSTLAITVPPAKESRAEGSGLNKSVLNLSHGRNRSRLVTESDLKNDPPADYVIPDGLVQDAKDGMYKKYFPKDSIQTVSITIPKDNLDYILQNAAEKPSAMTTSVTVGDTTVGYAGLKTKGNYTLQHTWSDSDSDRFSFTVNFGKYIKKKNYGKKQNFYGCSKISFNNCFFDKTFMKEYNALRLMDEMGLPTPQYSLAKLYINNEYYGVYFMVEAMDGAIIERWQNVSSKEVSDYLTKPDYTHLNYNFEPELEACVNSAGEITMEALSQKGLMWKDEATGEYGVGTLLEGKYHSLWESDYETLQDVGGMIPQVLTWNRKIQLLADGKDFSKKAIDVNSAKYLELLNSVMDTEETVKYFATHSFVIQMDNMFSTGQNYGLYVDKNGKSMMVPWDYDLAWGCFEMPITPEEVANWDIESLYARKETYRENPLFYVIYQNKSLMKKFKTYIEDCSKIVSTGGVASDGKKYEPGRFARTIGTYSPQIISAAGEGIPAIKKIVAMRATGVWLQTHGLAANVTGYGCGVGKLGNDGAIAHPSTSGNLTAVNENTGIFATATYGQGTGGPLLNVLELGSEEEAYKTVKSAVDRELTLYKIWNTKTPASAYKLYIPVSPDAQNVKIYSYSKTANQLTELSAQVYDNIYCVTVSDLSYIAVASGTAGTNEKEDDTAADNKPGNSSAKQDSGTEVSEKNIRRPGVPKIKTLKNTGRRKMKLTWKKVPAASGYQIRYAANKKFSKAKKITVKKKSTTKRVISRLKKGKKYYVQIRSFKTVSGKKKYSKWSAKKSVKIKR